MRNRFIILIIVFMMLLPIMAVAQIMTLKGTTQIYLKSGSIMTVKGGMKLSSGTSIVHDNTGISNFYFSGLFDYYGTYSQNNYGIFRFIGSQQDSINGNDITFERLWVMKSGSAMVRLGLGTDVLITDDFRLITNNLFDIHKSTLTIDSTAMIYPDSVSNYLLDPLSDPFTDSKHITAWGDSISAGKLTRRIKWANSLGVDLSLRFPIGTVNDTSNPTARYYSPVRYVFNAGQAQMGKGAYISAQVIAGEHYATEVKEVALKKYWRITADSVKSEVGGYNIRFNYNQNDVQGFEELYFLCLFYRPVDLTYYINRGTGYGVEPINNRFYVDEVDKKDTLGGTRLLIDGEWTAGQEEAISTFYYSRADGDWNTPSTWSKQGYGGAASTTIPNNLNDKVFIGNGKTVTLSSSSAEINKTTIDNTGKLKITSINAVLQGDSLFVKAGGTLAVSNSDGLHPVGVNLGNIRTSKIRSFSSDGIYEFIGNSKQETGPAIPDIVASLIISKDAISDTLSLTKSILIKDSLVINQGVYHLFRNGNFTSNGETGDTTDRHIIMRGGDFVMQNYPTNYKNGVFTAGTISFAGTSSVRIPSSEPPGSGEPSVTQYHNVDFEGARGTNTIVTLDPTGEIRIGGELDISQLTFNPLPISDRYLVTGSKVIFNGSTDQQIQTGYSLAVGLNYRLKFHELIIDGAGNKNIMNPNDISSDDNYVLVRSHLRIKNGTLKSNNYWIKCLGNWTCSNGGDFDAGSGLVTFEADGKVTNIVSNGSSFNNLRIMGTLANGYVNFTDSLNIAGNLEINPNTLRSLGGSPLAIQGNWYNKGAFVANTGRVYFNGTGDQTLDHNGEGTFYQITVNKPTGMVKLNGDSLIKISNNLTLTKGNIGGNRVFNAPTDSVPNKPLVVDGTITRPIGTPGHVDGRLRLPTVEGANSVLFPIGIGNDYNPLQLTINGPGGRAGYLDGYLLTDTQAPNLNSTIIASQLPNGAELDNTKNVQKVWVLNADSTLPVNQRFLLQSSSRNFDLELFFLNTDIRGGANYNSFVMSQRDSTINTNRWTYPFVSVVNANSIKIGGITNLKNNTGNYFMTGEPQVFTYYSIADGNFRSLSTWSIYGYLGTEIPSRAPRPVDNIRIGNGKKVTFDSSFYLNTGRTFVVETGAPGYENGHLEFTSDTSRIWGAGTFRLDSGAAITILHAEGISTGALGCIRTTTRYYNYNNHNSGHFIYARSTAGNQSVGNGLPLFVRTLQCDQGIISNQLTFPAYNIYNVSDSIYINRGNVIFSNINTKIGGNFIVEIDGAYNFGTQTLDASYLGNPSTGQQDSSSAKPGGLMFVGSGIQNFWVKRTNPDSIIIINRLSLVKPSGKIISRNNINAGQLFFHEGNRANYNGMDYNKWIWARVNTLRVGGFTGNVNTDPGWTMLADPKFGYVEGRLLRSVNNNRRQFPIGTPTKYTPMDIQTANVQTGGNGLMEVQAIDGNHRLFNSGIINQNTNIQRYYEISLPVDTASTLVIGNNTNLTFRARVIFTQDEPRGGINPVSYDAFRLSDTTNRIWTNVTNILTDSNTTSQMLFNLNTAPRLPNNNIFNVKSEFSNARTITFMIGEPYISGDRVFYSKNSGNWRDPANWVSENVNILYENTEIGYSKIGNFHNDYPRYNTGTNRDYAIIGDGDSIYFNKPDSLSLQYVLLEKSANGVGKLVMPGNSYLKVDQFVQKNGGKLLVGSPTGISDTAYFNGAIRRLTAASIVNFDWNQLGLNHFAYIGTAAQATGSGLPSRISSLEINNTSGAVTLTNDAQLNITDSLIFFNGTFLNQNGNRTISLKGDLVTHTNNSGIDASSNRALIMDSTRNQQIRGNADSTIIPNTFTINKTSGSVTANQNVRFNSILDMQSNTLFNLSDNKTITFGNTATISNINTFGSNKMIKVSGTLNSGKLRKTYPTGTNQTSSFTFPVGDATYGYGEAKYDLNSMDFGANNYLEFALINQYPHYSLTGTPNVLKKYWRTNTSGITLNTGGNTNVRFRYNDNEVVGNILNYSPTLYRRSDISALDPGWSSTLFNPTSFDIDTTNKHIIVNGSKTLPYHDWSAADPTAFARGKIYYSRASGNWKDGNTWTNITNSGLHNINNDAALNYPGFYENDTVYVGADHIVTFDGSLNSSVDSLGIGITSPSTSPELRFSTAASSNKSLNIDGSLMIGTKGLLSKSNTPTVTSIDTILIQRDFSNTGEPGRGVAIHPDVTRNVRLVFNGTDSTKILGEGNYTSIGNVEVLKADSVWNTINNSASFSSSFSSAVLTIPSVDFDLNAGMYVHDVNADITLSTDGDGDVFLGDLVGLVVRDGNVKFSDGLICGQNASVWLTGGDMTIGNQKSENFLYESVTIINLENISKLKVAGSMRRRFATSNVDFRIKDNAQIEVMIKGDTTNSDNRRAAFDFGEANSLFSMTDNSKVIIYRPMELSSLSEKDPDYLVSASTFTVTGGTVQFGHPDTVYTGEPFTLIASVPFWNLDIANTYNKDLFVGSPIVTIRNNFNINEKGIFNQNGNNINIGGDYFNSGLYKSGNSGTRRVSFFGDTSATPATKKIQTISIKNSNNESFFDFVVNKPDSGLVVLSNNPLFPYSNIILSNTLEFSVNNTGLISTGDDRFVQVGTNVNDLASIQRFGNGHVNGFLRRWINNGPQDKLFTVGVNRYTPARIVTTSGDGTPGLLSVRAYNIQHPDIGNADDLQTDTDIDRYWQIVPAGSSPFALGSGRSFDLTLFFIKGSVPTGDVKPGSTFGIFEHFRRTPKYNDPGDWFTTVPFARTDSSTTTTTNTEYGDFIIGEIAGERFFSKQNGDWNDASTWVMGSYSGVDASRAPIDETDRVFIGNGKTVTIQNSNPRVRSTTIEVANGLPGKLRIIDERYLRGLSFSLNDNCFVATDDAFGFTAISGATPNIGAVRSTSIRSYGKATYEYIGTQAQATGDGPALSKTILINNTGATNNTVSFSPFTYTIEDSIFVNDGRLLMGTGLRNLKGNFVVSNGASVGPDIATLNLNNNIDQYFVMNDSSGIDLYNFRLSKTAGTLFLNGTADSAKLKIRRNLEFISSNNAYISARSSNKGVILAFDTTTVTRTGLGHIDGLLMKQMVSGAISNYKFEVGVGSQYLPVTLNVSAGSGTSGLVACKVNNTFASTYSRIHPSKRVNYNWLLAPWTNFALGSRTATTLFTFPNTELVNLTGGVPNLAYLLRRSIPAEIPRWTTKDYSQTTWNTSTATVVNNSNEQWTGLGQFFISEYYLAAYYSRQNGNWNDNNTWTLETTHIGPPIDIGDFPGYDPFADESNVYVGLNHIVTLNVADPNLDTLIVRHDSELDMTTNSINCANCSPTKGLFDLQDNATISFGATNLPSSTNTLKNFKDYLMGSNTTVKFYGTQTVPPNPFSYSFYPGNVRISNVGIKNVIAPVLIYGNLFIDTGATLNVGPGATALTVKKSIINSASIYNEGIIELDD